MNQNPTPHPSSLAVRQSFSRWAWLLIVLALMIGYPLSVGPACWLADRGLLPKNRTELLDVPYFPLVYVCQTSELTSKALSWYIDLWTQKPERPANETPSKLPMDDHGAGGKMSATVEELDHLAGPVRGYGIANVVQFA